MKAREYAIRKMISWHSLGCAAGGLVSAPGPVHYVEMVPTVGNVRGIIADLFPGARLDCLVDVGADRYPLDHDGPFHLFAERRSGAAETRAGRHVRLRHGTKASGRLSSGADHYPDQRNPKAFPLLGGKRISRESKNRSCVKE